MSTGENLEALDDILRHARAGLKALEAVRAAVERDEPINHTHLKLASAELANAIHLALRLSLRTQ
jgi:hypothetical protein